MQECYSSQNAVVRLLMKNFLLSSVPDQATRYADGCCTDVRAAEAKQDNHIF
jgi:hypothetical protein